MLLSKLNTKEELKKKDLSVKEDSKSTEPIKNVSDRKENLLLQLLKPKEKRESSKNNSRLR